MKRILALSAMLFIVFLSAKAQVPQTISYQGFYKDESNNPVDGNGHKVTFKFLDAITNQENTSLAREIENVTINDGIISLVIGAGDPNNTTPPDNLPLPLNVWTQSFKIQVLVDDDAVGDPVLLTTVPYSFVAGSVDGNNITGSIAAAKISGTLPGNQVGSGISAANLSGSVAVANGGTGSTTASDARTALGLAIGTDVQAYNADLQDLAEDGSLSGSKVGPGISAANLSGSVAVANGGTGSTTASDARTALGLTIGADVQAYNADLQDLAEDGSLSGSKVGSGVSTANLSGSVSIANGGTGATTAGDARTALGLAIGTNVQAFDADLTDLADGSLTGSKVGTGISATNVTTGTLANGRLSTNIDVAGYLTTVNGLHVGSATAPGTDNLEVDGYTKLGIEAEAPAIKMKKLTATANSVEGGETTIAHGLTISKILSVTVLIEGFTDTWYPPNYTFSAELEYYFYVTTASIRVRNSATNSNDIRSKPIKVLITYEQ